MFYTNDATHSARVWYNPPIGAPVATSNATDLLRCGLGRETRDPIHNFSGKMVVTMMTPVYSICDLIKCINPLRACDSPSNEAHNLVSIVAAPFFSVGVCFGYFPRWDLSRGNLDDFEGSFGNIKLEKEEFSELIRTPTFFSRLQKSSWVKKPWLCYQLLRIIIENNDRELFNKVLEEAKKHINLDNATYHLFDGRLNQWMSLSFFKILLKYGIVNYSHIWHSLLYFHRDSTIDDNSKRYIDAILNNRKRISSNEVDIEKFILNANSEVELMHKVIVAGMFIRAGVRLNFNLTQFTKGYEWAQEAQDVLNSPEDLPSIQENIKKIHEEGYAKDPLISLLSYEFYSLTSSGENVHAWRNGWNNKLNILKIFKNNFLPKLERMQAQVREIEDFRETFEYCSARELKKEFDKVRNEKHKILAERLKEETLGDLKLCSEIESYI